MQQENRPFSEQVTAARRAMGITQTDLAERIGSKQSAVSMFERGNVHALSQEKIGLVAELLEIPFSTRQPDQGPAAAMPLRYCPLFDCPANKPFVVQGKVLALPRPDAAGHGKHCRFCGELLESRCPGCGQAIEPGACCPSCGSPYIPTPESASPEAAQHLIQQIDGQGLHLVQR